MTASLELHGKVAAHEARIESVEKRTDKIESKLDHIFWSVITTLASVLGAIITYLVKGH